MKKPKQGTSMPFTFLMFLRADLLKAPGQIKRRTSHKPNAIQPSSLMRSSAFDPIKFE